MPVVPISPTHPDPAVVEQAAELLRAGQIVAFPTETVYGLGANALDPGAIERVYQAKGRPAYNPLIVHVPDTAAATALVTEWPAAAARLAARWWPGPLTLVLPRDPIIPPRVSAGLTTIALRVPAHPVAQALLRAVGLPIAAPSANRSGEVSPTTAAHVEASLGVAVPLILDAGPTDVGIESTVIDLSGRIPLLLRPGMVSRQDLEALLGPLSAARDADARTPRPSPGMLDRHYAPSGEALLIDNNAEATQVIAARPGVRIGALVRMLTIPGVDLSVRLPPDPGGYGRGLYQALHQLDAAVQIILIERPPAEPAWEGIRDRLARGAHRLPCE
jgi:L-threonylcarbamoyladenylate synthase